MDRILEGITFTAARQPEYFPRVKGTVSLRRIIVGPALGLPRTRIWFTHDEECVYLRLAELAADDEKE
ncbi:MAG: hypothetical protein ACRD3M_07605 [Thermoanaerobaculia bacterium]